MYITQSNPNGIPFTENLSPSNKLKDFLKLQNGRIELLSKDEIQRKFLLRITTREFNIIKKVFPTAIPKTFDINEQISPLQFRGLARDLKTYMYLEPLRGL